MRRLTTGSAARTTTRPAGASILRLYPPGWRRRYEPEMLQVLTALGAGRRDRLDLVRGALDAWLHVPSRVPAVAAIAAGGIWTIIGAWLLAQPAPPDWPGFAVGILPFALLAAAFGGLATIGCWARRSDGFGPAGRIAIGLTILGHLAWSAALIVAWLGWSYGAQTMAAQALAAVGSIVIGVLLVRAGDRRLGAMLAIGPAFLLFGSPIGWLAAGLGWTATGSILLTELGAPGPFRAA